MRKTAILLALLAIIAGSCKIKQSENEQGKNEQSKEQTPLSVTVPQYGGIYAFGDTLKEGAAKGKAYIYPENDSTLLFYVYTNNGAPAYNSGSIDGRISVHNGKAVFRTRFGDAETQCVLRFNFRGDTLTIVQDNDECECGFGHGVYLDDTFLRITSETPLYYVTMANDKVYFSQWGEEGQSDENSYPHIDNRFIALFPDLVLGQEPKRGKLIPQEIVDEFLPDMPDRFMNNVQPQFYATGKIMNYRGVNLFILDYEDALRHDATYDNPADDLRFVLQYNKNGSPIIAPMQEDGVTPRIMDYIQSRYRGEDGEASLSSYFDKDTTVVSVQLNAEFNRPSNYQTALMSEKEYRWRIGDDKPLEITKLELSSPFYERIYLKRQSWYTETDEEECEKHYPTIKNQYPLLALYDEISETRILRFYLKRIGDELFPVFEVSDLEDVISQYIVGKPDEEVQQSDAANPVSSIFKAPVIIKTSDGDVKWFPGKGHIGLKE